MHRELPGARGDWRKEDGFTLLELMMVILIIAILIAVLLPVFLGATTRAKDRALQTNLTTALTAAKLVFTNTADYTQANPVALASEAGALTFVAAGTAPTTPTAVSVNSAISNSQIVLAGLSKSGTCFYILDDANAGTKYAKLPAAGGCASLGAPLPGDPAWKANW